MIKNKTTLILGAGASFHMGYPTGPGLINAILDTTISDQESLQFWKQAHRSKWQDYSITRGPESCAQIQNDFKNRLRRSALPSIDTFLNQFADDDEIVTIGKMLIHKALISTKHSSGTEGNWYKLLWYKIFTPKFEDLINNELTVITFNYDKSLENFLVDAIENSYQKLPKDFRQRFFNRVEFIHPYGEIEEPNPSSFKQLEYDVSRIKIFYEVVNSNLTEKIKYEIESSTNVYFIGFGFIEQNMRLINPEFKWNPQSSIKGSCYGMTGSEVQAVNSNFFAGRSDLISAADNTLDSYSFFRERLSFG